MGGVPPKKGRKIVPMGRGALKVPNGRKKGATDMKKNICASLPHVYKYKGGAAFGRPLPYGYGVWGHFFAHFLWVPPPPMKMLLVWAQTWPQCWQRERDLSTSKRCF